MSGSTLNDYASDYQEGGIREDVNLSGGYEDQIPLPEQPQQPSFVEVLLEKLKTPTGEGSLEDYYEVPLNMGKNEKQKRSFARILRGLSGFTSNLNLAIVDIVLGAFELNTSKGGGSNGGISTNSGNGVTDYR